MFSIKWRRPANIPYPQVWDRFEKTTKDGKVLKIRIQDITEDRQDDVLDFMTEHYLTSEPWNSNAEVCKDPVALETWKRLIRERIFPQKVSIFCTLDDNITDKPEIIGCNMLAVNCKNEPDDFSAFETMDVKPIHLVLNTYGTHRKFCPNVYEKYNVEEYLGAFGLVVHPDYRGLGIAVDLLKARVPILKAIGLKLTNTDFTATASQKSSYKAGFKVDASVSYDIIREATNLEFKDCINCEMSSLVID